MVPRGFISSLLCLSFLFAVFLCGALFCVSLFFNDENKVDAAWVEQNFSLPCAQLGVRQATFDVDLNIATLALDAPPPDSYWETLSAAGWHPVHEKGLVYATKDNMMLEYRRGEKHLTVRLRPAVPSPASH